MQSLVSTSIVQWSAAYNHLDTSLPIPDDVLEKLLRSAVIAFAASVVPDSVSNSLRIVGTYHQVNATRVGHGCCACGDSCGWDQGLVWTRLENAYLLQSIVLLVLWKLF